LTIRSFILSRSRDRGTLAVGFVNGYKSEARQDIPAAARFAGLAPSDRSEAEALLRRLFVLSREPTLEFAGGVTERASQWGG
jgi:hypothetical protein